MAAMEAIANLEIDDLTIATRAVMKTGTLSKMTIGDHRDEHRVRRMISRGCAVEIVVVDVVHHTIGIAVVVDTKNVVAAVAVMREMATVAETIIVTPVMVMDHVVVVDVVMVHVIWMAVVHQSNRTFHQRMMTVKVNVFEWGRTSQNMKIQM